MEKERYDFDWRILNAADYGAYTTRKRFFGIFAKRGLPIVFPEPTHCKDGKTDMFGRLEKWKPVKEVLDFSDEGDSIFCRKKPLAEKTFERIYAGLKPTEGKLSHHSIRLDNFKPSKCIAWNVAKEWLNEENAEYIEKICEAMAADNVTKLT